MKIRAEQCFRGLDARGDIRFLGQSPGVAESDLQIITLHADYCGVVLPGYEGSLTVFPLPSNRIAIMAAFEDHDRMGRGWPFSQVLILTYDDYAALGGNPFPLVRMPKLFAKRPEGEAQALLIDLALANLTSKEAEIERLLAARPALQWREMVHAAIISPRAYIHLSERNDLLAEAVLFLLPLRERIRFSFTTCLFNPRDRSSELIQQGMPGLPEPARFAIRLCMVPWSEESNKKVLSTLWNESLLASSIDLREGAAARAASASAHPYAQRVSEALSEKNAFLAVKRIVLCADLLKPDARVEDYALPLAYSPNLEDPLSQCGKQVLEARDREEFRAKIKDYIAMAEAMFWPRFRFERPEGKTPAYEALLESLASRKSPFLPDFPRALAASDIMDGELESWMTREILDARLELLGQANGPIPDAAAVKELHFWIDDFPRCIGVLPRFPEFLRHWLKRKMLEPLSERASAIVLMISYHEKKAGPLKALELLDLLLTYLEADPGRKPEVLADASAAYIECSIAADIFPLYKPHIQRIAQLLPASCPRFAALLLKGFGKESDPGDLAKLLAMMLADLDPHSPEFAALVHSLGANPGEPNSPESAAFQALQLAILNELMARKAQLPIDYARAAAKATLPPEALQRLKNLIAQPLFRSFCSQLKSAQGWNDGLQTPFMLWIVDKLYREEIASLTEAQDAIICLAMKFPSLLEDYARETAALAALAEKKPAAAPGQKHALWKSLLGALCNLRAFDHELIAYAWGRYFESFKAAPNVNMDEFIQLSKEAMNHSETLRGNKDARLAVLQMLGFSSGPAALAPAALATRIFNFTSGLHPAMQNQVFAELLSLETVRQAPYEFFVSLYSNFAPLKTQAASTVYSQPAARPGSWAGAPMTPPHPAPPPGIIEHEAELGYIEWCVAKVFLEKDDPQSILQFYRGALLLSRRRPFFETLVNVMKDHNPNQKLSRWFKAFNEIPQDQFRLFTSTLDSNPITREIMEDLVKKGQIKLSSSDRGQLLPLRALVVGLIVFVAIITILVMGFFFKSCRGGGGARSNYAFEIVDAGPNGPLVEDQITALTNPSKFSITYLSLAKSKKTQYAQITSRIMNFKGDALERKDEQEKLRINSVNLESAEVLTMPDHPAANLTFQKLLGEPNPLLIKFIVQTKEMQSEDFKSSPKYPPIFYVSFTIQSLQALNTNCTTKDAPELLLNKTKCLLKTRELKQDRVNVDYRITVSTKGLFGGESNKGVYCWSDEGDAKADYLKGIIKSESGAAGTSTTWKDFWKTHWEQNPLGSSLGEVKIALETELSPKTKDSPGLIIPGETLEIQIQNRNEKKKE